MNYKRILVLAPHTDDGELGCGGTISKLAKQGKEVFYAAFSLCEESLPKGLPSNTLEIEMKNATQRLGIPAEHLFILDFKVRYFKRDRQEILEELIKLRKNIQPDLVLLPSKTDIHQDHQTICEEGLRAFKHSSILGYEMPWNNFSFQTSCFVEISTTDIENKKAALREYKSQGARVYISDESVMSIARMRGLQSGFEFAEAFEAIRVLF